MTVTWPRERPAAGDRAVIKAAPDDFRVTELPGFEAEGGGEHLYLSLEKIRLATPEVARWLAACYGVPESAVGYAGLKDKQAVAEQWFSVHTPREADHLPGRREVRVVSATRHRRKLRRGQLAGNRFRLRLRDVTGDGWPAALADVRDRGVPNYFGPQRFGVDNLARAREWLALGRRRRGRDFRTGFHLSVLRSFLFNEVLARRVADGTWNRLLPGDAAVPLPRPATCAGPDCRVPTGPLWGRGRSAAQGEALAVEQAALEPYADLRDGLEHAGVEQQRRSLVLKAADLQWERHHQDLALDFSLPPGTYATTLLGAVFELATPPVGDL